MKICMLADATSIHTIKICNYLVNRGHKVYVISFQQGQIDGVETYCFNEKNLRTRSEFTKLKYLFYLLEIKKIVKEINPDILHAHYASSYGTIGSLISYKPYILSVWGSDIYIFPNKSKIHKSLLRYNLSKADIIMSTSEAMRQETMKYTDKKVYVTPFGVDFSIFKPCHQESADVVKIGITKTLNTVYGIDYLIKAFKIAKDYLEGIASVKLYIAGKGEHEEIFKNLVKTLELDQSVEFVGFLNGEELVKFYNMIDFAVYPSISESFGVSAIEAQACGKPVIVSDVGGLTEVTEPGETSIVVPSKNANDLSNAIIYLTLNENIRKAMGEKAYQYVRAKYNIIENFKIIENIYLDHQVNKDNL